MSDISAQVQGHYGTDGLGARILAALEDAGIDTSQKLTPEILAPLDQLHGRGFPATKELAAMVEIGAATRVLDIGCGIGGSSRYFAATYGCPVKGIDLTEEFIAAGRLLTERSELSGLVEMIHGNALDLPFEDAAFDLVWSHNATMNIEDKAGLYGEAFRVLVPGGRCVFAEIAQGPAGAPPFPLPWARQPEISFLATPDETRKSLAAAGFEIVAWVDETAALVRTIEAERAQRSASGPPEGPDRTVVLGEDMGSRVSNSNRGFADGQLIALRVVAGKPQ